MATKKEWAEFFSGEYDGRFCNNPGDWEDLIGTVTLKCVPGKNDVLKVTIKSIEISGWRGTLQLKEMVLTIFTGVKKKRFNLAFRESPDGRGGSFFGEIPGARGRQVMKISLTLKQR